MIRDLDETVQKLLHDEAPDGTELKQADIVFDIPDADWRKTLQKLTVNCYLYDVRENRDMRTHEPLLARSAGNSLARRVRPPVRIDCAYCLTAWSPATEESSFDEHRLLSQVLMVLLQNHTLPPTVLQGSLANQIPPFPTVVATFNDIKNQPDFWRALDQQLKPSLNYVVTLAVLLDGVDGMGRVVETVHTTVDHWEKRPK